MRGRSLFLQSLVCFSTSMLLWPLNSQADLNFITKFTVKDYPGFVRCRIESKQPLHYEKIFLQKQPRLVIDAYNTYLLSQDSIILWTNRAVSDFRYAYKKDNRLRMVLDLKGQYSAKESRLSFAKDHQNVLILDLIKQKPKAILPAPKMAALTAHRVKFLTRFHKHSTKAKSHPVKPKRQVVIVIDPGHGGKDPGALGMNGINEKDIVLQISRMLQKDINQQSGFKAILTRKGDYYLTLRERLARAREYRADMFIAIHADAYMHSDAYGASVYALSLRGATSEAARWIAKKENESELMGGVDLGDKSNLLKTVLLNLSQSATLRASIRVGRRIIKSLGDVTDLHRAKVEQAAFVVLKSPDIPSLLVETGFISNPSERRKLITRAYQQHIAWAIMQGIKSYFVYRPPRGTELAMHKLNKRLH